MNDWLERVLLSLEDEQLRFLQQIIEVIKGNLGEDGLLTTTVF